MKRLQKYYLSIPIFLMLLITMGAQAQLKSVILGVNGLHCSACSYGTEQALRQLDFIKDISMDLNKHEALITFLPSKDIDLKAIAQKVVDAGFTVRDLYLVIDFNNFAVKDNTIFPYLNANFHFVKVKNQTLESDTRLQVIGSDFMSKAAFKKWKADINTPVNSLPLGTHKTEYFVTI